MDAAEFDAMARVQQRHWWYRALRRKLARALAREGRPLRILDAGCGTGAHLAALSELGLAFGVDASQYALRKATSAPTACADGKRLPFADGEFDAAVSCDVLCHEAAGDPAAHLDEIARVLRPGGLLLLNLPAYPRLLSRHDRAVANARRFSRREMVGMLEAAGLTIERVTHWNLLLMPAAIGHRYLVRSAQSDLSRPPGALEQAAGAAATAIEDAWLRVAPLPAGLSIFAVARKPRKAVESAHG